MDPIKLYLKDIKHIPLLSPQEEQKLATRVKKGDRQAREQMIKSNLRLVINIAKRYSYLGLSMLDLIEEGNMGLMHAVGKYNPRKGYRFSTYAAWWIKQYITRAIANQGKTIRIPVYMVELLMKFKKISDDFTDKHRRKPGVGEIAKKMRLPVKKVRKLGRIASKIASLNAPISEEDETEFMDLVEDETSPVATDEVGAFLRQERKTELLNQLSTREKRVLSLRYGIKDGKMRTLDETSKVFHITRERVRQIENTAIRKLRYLLTQHEKEFIKNIKED